MASQVKRYDFELVDDRDALGVKVVQRKTGKYVLYATLERQLNELRAALEGKWISVEEVIPDDEGPVIVHIPDWSSHRVDVGFYRRNVSTQSEYWMVRSMKAPVTHYQPLPTAPKEAS